MLLDLVQTIVFALLFNTFLLTFLSNIKPLHLLKTFPTSRYKQDICNIRQFMEISSTSVSNVGALHSAKARSPEFGIMDSNNDGRHHMLTATSPGIQSSTTFNPKYINFIKHIVKTFRLSGN